MDDCYVLREVHVPLLKAKILKLDFAHPSCHPDRYFNDNLREDKVPYSDFDAPVDSSNPRDSSSTAIVASALLEIFQLTGESTCMRGGGGGSNQHSTSK